MTDRTDEAFEILPLYGQVYVGDAGDVEYPEFETGEEAVVTSAYAIVVATRSDADGPVTVHVRHAREPNSEAHDAGPIESVVFDGDLLIPSGELLVGNQLAQQFETFATPSVARLCVRVDTPGLASSIVVEMGDAAEPLG